MEILDNVNTDILVKICVALNCTLSDIMEIVPDKGKEEKANGSSKA